MNLTNGVNAVIDDNRGSEKKNPAFQIHKDSSNMAAKYEELFGILPFDEPTEAPKKSAIQEFLESGGKPRVVE